MTITNKDKSLLNVGTWEKIVAGLLSIIIIMLAYYINRITEAQDDINLMMKDYGQNIRNIAAIVDDDPDTSDEDGKELRKIYFVSRGQSIK